MLFIDKHLSGRPNPTCVVRHAKVERVTQIVIRPAPSLLRGPSTSPAEYFASDVSVEFPLLLFLFFIIDWDIDLTAHVVWRVDIGLVHKGRGLVVRVLGDNGRRADIAER